MLMMNLKRIKKRIKRQQGIGLVETLVAVAILGTAVVSFMVALSTGAISVGEHDRQTTAQQLVQAQLEYIKSYNYDAGALTYPAIAAPAGHAISVTVSPVPGGDTDIQMVTVIITRDGENILEISDYKVNR
jgi:type II secretory pathway pseudopilin PulG